MATQESNKNVPMADGSTVKIGRITWTCWKNLKSRVMEAMENPTVIQILKGVMRAVGNLSDYAALKAVEDSEDAELDTDVSDFLSVLDEKLAEFAPEALKIVNRILDEMTEELLQDALVSGTTNRPEAADRENALSTLYSIPAHEWQMLRDEVIEFNKIQDMFQSEKNSAIGMIFAGIMPSGGPTASPATGGSTGNTSSSKSIGS